MKYILCKREIEKICDAEGNVLWEKGNNAEPVEDGRCCDDCNDKVVIPARIEEMRRSDSPPSEHVITKGTRKNIDMSRAASQIKYYAKGAKQLDQHPDIMGRDQANMEMATATLIVYMHKWQFITLEQRDTIIKILGKENYREIKSIIGE